MPGRHDVEQPVYGRGLQICCPAGSLPQVTRTALMKPDLSRSLDQPPPLKHSVRLSGQSHITYIMTGEGWAYLATVIDIASRRVVGYALADHLRTELIADAVSNAVAGRAPAPGGGFD